MQRLNKANQMTTSLQLLIPKTENILGVTKTTFIEDFIFSCNFSTYGGTENISNDIYSVIDTAEIVCWFNPRIKSNCRVKRLTDNAVYEIIGEPENLEMRNMLMKFKVRRIKGEA